jgi:hypothetical protein
MMIIGCDFHPSWQQVAWVETETGECGERKLVHAAGEAKMFYQQLGAPALIGMEATGNSQWFIELVEDLRHVIWIGDAAQIRASYVRKQKTDKRDAAQRRAGWPYDSTGCCAPRRRIQRSFASRAARGCPWSAQARPMN